MISCWANPNQFRVRESVSHITRRDNLCAIGEFMDFIISDICVASSVDLTNRARIWCLYSTEGMSKNVDEDAIQAIMKKNINLLTGNHKLVLVLGWSSRPSYPYQWILVSPYASAQ